MNHGDIVVCGVRKDEIIEDIGKSVPQGVAVAIPGDLAYKSKDLWVLLSQERIYQLNVNSLLKLRKSPLEPVPDPQEAEMARSLKEANSETARLSDELAKAHIIIDHQAVRIAQLESELSKVRADSSQAGKLDDILSLLKERPVARESHITTPGLVKKSDAHAPSFEDVSMATPMYIPGRIKSDSEANGQVSVKQESSDASALADASKVLKGLKRKGS